MRTGVANLSRSGSRGQAGRQRPARRAGSSRRNISMPTARPKRSQKSFMFKALEGIGSVKRSGSRPQQRGGTRKKGEAGIALIASAAGLAMKNRDKLTSMFSRKHDPKPAESPTPAAASHPDSGPYNAGDPGGSSGRAS